MRLLARPAVSLALSLLAFVVALVSLGTLAIARGSAAGWVHWLCSPALRSATRLVHHSGLLATVLGALALHWPHFLPALLAIATLFYLWRANRRYEAEQGR